MKGRITKTMGRYYTVDNGEKARNCVLRGRLKKELKGDRFSNLAATGDFVEFTVEDDGTGVIQGVNTRKNVFSRKDSGNRGEDIVASNLDIIVIIQSFLKPRLNLRFVDRLLVRSRKEGVPALLCVNKNDLASEDDIHYIEDYYRHSGIDILFTAAVEQEGIEDLREMIKGKTALFAGSSGVGKTSILNCLYPGTDFSVKAVSDSTGKGRHTTTNVQLVSFEDGTGIIDTPGMREFGLLDIEPESLSLYFHEFGDFRDSCRFRPCTHDHEPGCALKEEVDEGTIFYDRYVSYLQILYSIKDYYENMY